MRTAFYSTIKKITTLKGFSELDEQIHEKIHEQIHVYMYIYMHTSGNNLVQHITKLQKTLFLKCGNKNKILKYPATIY